MQRNHTIGLATLAIVAGVGACTTSCVVAGTPVRTPDGSRPIEQLRVGDTVCTWSTSLARLVTRAVTEVHTGTADHRYDVQLADGRSLSLTAEHPVFCVETRTWRTASTLRAGATLWVVDDAGEGHAVAVRAVERVACDGLSVFNLSVDTDETFLANGVLVHNKTKIYDTGFDTGFVDVVNAPPSVVLEAPASDAVLTADTPVVVQARVNDAEDGPAGLTLALDSTLDGPLGVADEALTAGGTWSGTVQLGEGTHTLRLVATDTDGASALDEVTVTVGPAAR